MQIVDLGAGAPVVVIPGAQGRWEWMAPAVAALAAAGVRVLTFSLADEPTSHADFDDENGFESYIEQVREALDQAHVGCAAICGVSYGGLIAAAFAARYPQKTASLVLVSALPPSWRPDRRILAYTRHPWLWTPLFCAGSVRLFPEILAAADSPWRAIALATRHVVNVLRHMLHPGRMARRVRLVERVRIGDELGRVQVPVLVVTGEDRLDRVVSPRLTRQYLRFWPRAKNVILARTGHLGLVTRATEFANVVASFVGEHAATVAGKPGCPRETLA